MNRESCTYEDLLKIVIDKNLAAKQVLRSCKTGEKDGGQSDVYDFEKYLAAKKEIESASKEEKKKLLVKYKSDLLPSELLYEAFEEDSA